MKMFMLLCASLCFTACMTHVEPGHVGVLVHSCEGGGVDPKPLAVGYHSTGACTSVVEYPVYVQTAVWSKNPNEGHPSNEEITFTNADQMQIAADISLAYQLKEDKVPAFYSKFRADNLDAFTHGFLRNLAREKFDTAAGKYKIGQIMGDNATFLKEVRDLLQADLDPYGVQLNQFGFIGAPRPPQSVIDAINARSNATQKAFQIENELKQSEAQAKKNVAQAEGESQAIRLRADAEAYANERVAKSVSQTLVDYERVKKWDGRLPQVSGSGNPFINLNKQ